MNVSSENILRPPLSLSTYFVGKMTFIDKTMAVLEIQLLMRYSIFKTNIGNLIIPLHPSSQILRYMYTHCRVCELLCQAVITKLPWIVL